MRTARPARRRGKTVQWTVFQCAARESTLLHQTESGRTSRPDSFCFTWPPPLALGPPVKTVIADKQKPSVVSE